MTTAALGALLATAVLPAFRWASPLRGDRASERSIVHPVARGTGPLPSFDGAIVLPGERLSDYANHVFGATVVAPPAWRDRATVRVDDRRYRKPAPGAMRQRRSAAGPIVTGVAALALG